MKTRLLFFTIINILLLDSCVGWIYLPDTPEFDPAREEIERTIDQMWIEARAESDTVIISTPSLGNNVTINGTIMDDGIYSFQGIKYANASRFQIPVTNDQFPDYYVIDATDFGFKCPQSRTNRSDENEDCQYLNIYTPQNPEEMLDKVPVMIFIHGGAFVAGSSNGYLPGYLVPHNVLLVTINYRLGALGFFTIGTDEAPGDYALYDQIAALRWVRDHIGDFGGDNTSMTVFGESAGSVSASYMTIVADEDTIHKAISESGTFSEVWSLDTDPEYAANYIADYVGCLDNETEEINMTCMCEADAFDLTAAELDLVAEDRANGLMGFRGCAPTIQPESITHYILIHWPQWYYENKQYNDVPYMMGTNKDEGSLITLIADFAYLRPNNVFDNETYLREAAITDILGSFAVEDPSHAITNTLILEYCFGVDLTDYYESAPCLIDMFGMLFLKAGGWKVSNLHAHYGTQKTFHYSFDYDPDPDSLIGKIIAILVDLVFYDVGVIHGAELTYLFPGTNDLEGMDKEVSDRMTEMWTNMAIYGDPTPDGEGEWQELGVPKFTPYYSGDNHYMLLREEFIMQTEFPLRWTIRYDECVAGEEVTMEPPHTEEGNYLGRSLEDMKKKGMKEERFYEEMMREISRRFALEPVSRASEDDVEHMESKRDAYMITMIVFIVLFCIADCAACYFFMKSRKRKQIQQKMTNGPYGSHRNG